MAGRATQAKREAKDAARHPLGIVAAGLVCYGIYCLVDARYRDVSTGVGW